MEDLIERVSTAAGIEPEVARKAIGIILSFLQKEGPADEVGKVMDAVPGSREAASSAAGEAPESSGFLGGLMGGGGGLMGLASQLTGIGLGMGEMQTVGREIFAFAREKVGEDTVGQIAGAIPGLSALT
ncbi:MULTISPECIES: DUF2267 domain-containing protein [Lichenihabitans]|uniref:DUF2267 domain-containing protein n=1 Tax=Lichenihabitans TaxID=2723776 RepID=UPI00103577C3|nr:MULTISPECIES: DUF2267 domain-containing protein [Lichenihabitans]UDL94848.1 DUF2267 domain-containing protein [Lichenihabitans sp. PAMC28606]